MLARRAGCDEISWSESKQYHGLAYDRASREWTDKGAARCGPKRVWRGMGMSRTECKKDCEGNGLCEGVLLNPDEETYGTCWTCTFDPEDCGEF